MGTNLSFYGSPKSILEDNMLEFGPTASTLRDDEIINHNVFKVCRTNYDA